MPSMSLTQQERELLKSPRYFGTRAQIQPYVRQFMRPGQYHLTRVPNTIITCTGCQGSGYIIQEHTDRFGIMTTEKCPICNGSRVMPNSREAGY